MVSCFRPGLQECVPWPVAGSRADRAPRNIRSVETITSENAPSTRRKASAIASGKVCSRESGDQMHDHFGVAGGLENRSLALPAVRESPCAFTRLPLCATAIDALVRLHQNRLRVEQCRVAGRGVARVPDGQRSPQLRQHIFDKDIRDQAHGLVRAQVHPVRADDPRRLLPAMLQSMQPQVGELFRLGVRINRHHPALFTKFVRQSAMKHFSLRAKPSVRRHRFRLGSAEAVSSDRIHNSRNSETETDTTTRPSSLISICSGTVSPSTRPPSHVSPLSV